MILGFFFPEIFIGHLGLLLLYFYFYFYFYFFTNFSLKIFFGLFVFCLKGPNILLSGPNYGSKFNFIGHKKKKKKTLGGPKYFLRVRRQIYNFKLLYNFFFFSS